MSNNDLAARMRAVYASIVEGCELDIRNAGHAHYQFEELDRAVLTLHGAWAMALSLGVQVERPSDFRKRMEERIRRAA